VRLSASLDPFRIPAFALAATAVLLAILAEAMAGSYMTLLAVERIGMSPLELTAFLCLSALSSIAIASVFGRWHDRRPRLWPLLLCLLAGVVGFGLCAVINNPLALIAVGFCLLGFSNTSYALLFAIAKHKLDPAGPATASRGMAALRMISSLSWTIGPALGAALVGTWHFEGVYIGAAIMSLAALLVVLGGRLKPGPSDNSQPADLKSWRTIWPAALALTLFNTAMFAGSNAMSVTTVSVLGGSSADVGLLFSFCALIEVVVMAGFVIWPARHAHRSMLILGFCLFAFYFVLNLLLPSLSTLFWGQVPRGIAIGVVHVVGMLYVQQSMPRQPGAAAAVYSNALNAALLLSGIGTGTWAQAFGYFSLFGLCAVLAVIGGVLFAIGRYPKSDA